MFKKIGLVAMFIGMFLISISIVSMIGCGQNEKGEIIGEASIVGKVYDKDGNPASDVSVTLYSANASASSVVSFATQTKNTDSMGNFSFSELVDGQYNVLAEQSNDYKVIKQNVIILGGVSVNLGTLKLAQTGAISGYAYFVDKASHLGIDVFIPGTSFTAKTAADGSYSILYVPPGTFDLNAMYTAYQTATLEGITVESASMTIVANVLLYPEAGGTYGGVTFEIRDKFTGSKLQNVEITIGYVLKTTDVNGQVTFDKVWAASQSFTATKEDYQAYSGSVTITANTTVSETIWMTSDNFTITTWGSSGTGDGQFVNAIGIAVDSNSNVYVSDSEWYGNTVERVQKFDSNGNFILKWGSYGTGNGQFGTPWLLAIDSSNNVYVADSDNSRIQKFDSNGNFLSKFGSFGTGEGQFYQPKGVAIDSNGNIYIADSLNERVQKLDSSGNFLIKFGSEGSGDGQFGAASEGSPKGLAVDSDGNIYALDNANFRIQKFDSSGNFLIKWGSQGTGSGQFGSDTTYGGLKGIAIDNEGNVYVADKGNDRVQKFDNNGNFLTKWGTSGTGNGQFNGPSGIAVDNNGNVYVTDLGNDRIQKFSQ